MEFQASKEYLVNAFSAVTGKYFLGAKIIGKRFFVIEYAKIIVSNIYITEGKNIFNERLIKLKEFFWDVKG